jgi:N-acyl-D-aspartate/D-glutamate deacylase
MGNCGVGFAPCKRDDHERLIKLMEGVEDIPFAVLAEGLPWNWESFPDYLDALQARRFDVDIGTQLPHAALRVYVMGQRGADRDPATEKDIAAMAAIAKHAVEVGALGFSTSRTLNHRTSDGQPTPTLTASEDELTGIAMALKAAGKGVLQVVSDFTDPEAEFAMLQRIVEKSGRPLSFSLVQGPIAKDAWRGQLAALERANAAGLPMKAQVCARPVGLLFGFELTMNPFSLHPTYQAIAKLPLAERVARLRDSQTRARLLVEDPRDSGWARNVNAWDRLIPMQPTPDYEPTPDQSVAAVAARRSVSSEEIALDHLLTNDGRGMLYLPFLNYAEGSLDPAHEMLLHEHTIPGLSDGGAHVGMICDGSFPTSNLTLMTRDRTRGPKIELARMVKMQSRDTAEALGLHDRGLIKVGLRADLNVIDYDKLHLHAPQVAYDLPAGGRRLIQRADGYVATVVAGEITYRDGDATAALPGRLLRGAQNAPVAVANA